jgi:hypothetical protein
MKHSYGQAKKNTGYGGKSSGKGPATHGAVKGSYKLGKIGAVG